MKKWYQACLLAVTRKIPHFFRYHRLVPLFIFWRQHFSAQNCLLAALIIYGLLLGVSLFVCYPGSSITPLAWAPGYWQPVPRIGMARIVPFAGRYLRNPAASTGDRQVRQPVSP